MRSRIVLLSLPVLLVCAGCAQDPLTPVVADARFDENSGSLGAGGKAGDVITTQSTSGTTLSTEECESAEWDNGGSLGGGGWVLVQPEPCVAP